MKKVIDIFLWLLCVAPVVLFIFLAAVAVNMSMAAQGSFFSNLAIVLFGGPAAIWYFWHNSWLLIKGYSAVTILLVSYSLLYHYADTDLRRPKLSLGLSLLFASASMAVGMVLIAMASGLGKL